MQGNKVDPDREYENGRHSRINRVNILGNTLILMAVMVSYTSYLIYGVAVANVREAGEDMISGVAAQIENYLNTAQSVHWVTADTVDYMTRNGSSSEDILRYIMDEMDKYARRFDDNYSGLYGYIGGKYLNGTGWTPPAGYDPLTRPWYLEAIKAGGKSVIVYPYLEVQTRVTVISISRMLSNGRDVLSVNMDMRHIQEIIERLRVKGKGYAFIVDQDGKIIAHRDITRNGRFLTDTGEQRLLMDRMRETRSGNFEVILGGQMNTVFVNQIMDQWRLAIVIDNEELYTEIRKQLGTTGLVCVIIFIVIAVFFYLGYQNEQNYFRRREKMRIKEQKRAYEAEVLELEKDAADRANKAKSNFLADMSHEIRTPINAVLGMNEMILRESGDPAIAAYARNVESAGRNLLAIINDILDFSKIEAGRMEIMSSPYRLSSLLNDLCNMILFQAQSKGIAFDVEVDETMPDALCGDEVRVRQVISNLLSNAVKYTKEGGVTLRVQGTREGDRLNLVVSVADTGIGIREADMKKLFGRFNRFNQMDEARSKTAGRNGLGLVITQNLLRLMDGSIHVGSEYEKGSVFTITIPQGVVSEEPVGDFHRKFTQCTQDIATSHESFRAPDARLLVVDDTEMNLTVVCGLLRGIGIQIDTASSGAGALMLTKKTPYDLILMDQRMPEMDGTETLRRIREQEGGCNNKTPVICLTADAVQGARERYLAEGFTDYLSKPIEAAAIEAALITYLPAEKVVSTAGLCNAEDSHAPHDANEEPKGETGKAAATLRGLYATTDALDYDLALKYLISDELLEKTLRQFYEAIPAKAEELKRLLAEGDYENYTVKIHALKSSSRLIGANDLSEGARYLEECGDVVLQKE